MDIVLAAFLLGLALIASTALLGFLALAGAWYMTHRTVEIPKPFGKATVGAALAAMVPPPVAPELSEIVLHPEVEDYIKIESEDWYREQLREKAKSLYAQQPAWPWVLAELRKLNEGPSLPSVEEIG